MEHQDLIAGLVGGFLIGLILLKINPFSTFVIPAAALVASFLLVFDFALSSAGAAEVLQLIGDPYSWPYFCACLGGLIASAIGLLRWFH